MSHANATLTGRHRLKVARLVRGQGMLISEVAARFQVSWPTVKRYEHDAPGSLVHVDVTKLGNIPDGHFNQHGPHTACGGQPPFSRLINISGQYN